MYIALAYDISSDNGERVRKLCEKYLIHVQKSVFEGRITERKLETLKSLLTRCIEPDEDSIIIYRLDPFGTVRRESIGKYIRIDLKFL